MQTDVSHQQVYQLSSSAGLELLNVQAEAVTYQGRPAVRLIEDYQADGSAIALIEGSDFQDGIIEADLVGGLIPNAPPEGRGFVGIAYRVQPHARAYECFYLRPTNGRAEDQLRRNHATQYIAMPDYPWQKLRAEQPGVYESYADMLPDEWTRIRIEVAGQKGRFFVNDAPQPCLIVNDLKMAGTRGQIGLWIGCGTVAHFRRVVVR
ncbi:MAG: hypothetical protein K8L91_09380 [Anaerolineae bacterium]|nr:hypothetical protein [Anaerolineae bacterium]